jgi:uncharacterized protein (TIGR00297 family)
MMNTVTHHSAFIIHHFEMPHETNETLRKFLHIALGFGAVSLRYLNWRIVAVVCLVAALGNWLLLHRLVGKRVARHERGWDAGIVLYPLAVFALVVTFNWHVELAAIAWAILAFGDGFATLAGRTIPIARLPWNPAKSWGGFLAFLVAAAASGYTVAMLFGSADRLLVAVLVAALAAAIGESLPLGVDDNLTVPLAAAIALAVFGIAPMAAGVGQPVLWTWLGINTLFAIAGYAARSVDLSGALAGWILGTLIVVGGGPALYVALIAFFVAGTACTKLGYRRKAAAGLAQEQGGRRGAGHAFANAGIAAICAVACWRGLGLVPLFMGIAALATAAADTVASEVGQLAGRRTFMPLTFRPVERGTEGAISLEGTLAGIVAALIVAIAGTAMAIHRLRPAFTGSLTIDRTHAVAVFTLAAFLGSYLESIAGSWNRRQGSPVANGALNFFNTAAGAFLFWVALHFVPVFGFEFF